MREGLEALFVPYEAPVITDLNHMSDAVIFPYKSATWFEGEACWARTLVSNRGLPLEFKTTEGVTKYCYSSIQASPSFYTRGP